MRIRVLQPAMITAPLAVAMLVLACSPAPRITNFDAARVAVEVAETGAVPGSAGTYGISLMSLNDVQTRFEGSEVEKTTLSLLEDDLEAGELVWTVVVTLDARPNGSAGMPDTERPVRRLVLVDTGSGLPLYSVSLNSNLPLPGGLHAVSELKRAP